MQADCKHRSDNNSCSNNSERSCAMAHRNDEVSCFKTMHYKPVLYVIGLLLMTLAALMCIPFLTNVILETPSHRMAFTASPLITLGVGLSLWRTCRTELFGLRSREIFLLTNLSWIMVCVFGALPFIFETEISFTDAFFEAMSGITTTGSTVLVGLDSMNPGILMWRSVLQWLGGIGFIVMAVAVLPFLKVGGMRLFQSESSDWSEKVMPRSGVIAKRIVQVYIGLTFLCGWAYHLGGMTIFEAINHSMTTLSTGGYSTSDASMGNFANPTVHWTGTLFMLLGSLPFVLLVRFFSGSAEPLWKDCQVRGFLKLLVFVWLTMTMWLIWNSEYSAFEALTLVAFNTTSVISTTGFALTDYSLWGGFAGASFFLLSFIGGCSGSTSGGVKIFRFQLGLKLLDVQLKLMSHPRACFSIQYNGQPITSEITRSFVGFTFFFLMLTGIMTLLLSLMGLDFITSLTGAVTAIANVGPGLGDIIGPAGNFSSLPDMAKWVLSIGMLMGRLEIITVLVMFTKAYWQR